MDTFYLWIGGCIRCGGGTLRDPQQSCNFERVKVMFLPGAAYSFRKGFGLRTTEKCDQCFDDDIHVRELMNFQGRQTGWNGMVFCGTGSAGLRMTPSIKWAETSGHTMSMAMPTSDKPNNSSKLGACGFSQLS